MYTVTGFLEEMVRRFGDKIAYVDDRREVSFRNFKNEAQKVATCLINMGIKKSPILVYMDKSIDCVATFFGIAYSGNFYSPIDTSMPNSRVRKIVDTLQPKVIITKSEYQEKARLIDENATLLLYENLMEGSICDEKELYRVTSRIIDTDILYVFFTSGSTGTPKGVLISHRNVIDYNKWLIRRFGLNETITFANQVELYFDLSVQDVYMPAFVGSKTVLLRNRLFSAPTRVWRTMIDEEVNAIVWVPSMISLFANLDILAHVDRLKLKFVMFCGEVMPVKQLNYWIEHYPEAVYVNLYGPTECTVACTYYEVDRAFGDSDILPIGRPCENSDAIVVGDDGEIITECGKTGELCIRGTTVGLGYYKNEKKTREVFVQNPVHDFYPETVYRTGDIVEYNSRGELMYVTRRDFQIKYRGYRIELGEIEAAASSITRVEYSCCLFDREKERLVLIYTGAILPDDVRQFLIGKLQNYMIPERCIRIEKMLFNINGKIDRKRLEALYV